MLTLYSYGVDAASDSEAEAVADTYDFEQPSTATTEAFTVADVYYDDFLATEAPIDLTGGNAVIDPRGGEPAATESTLATAPVVSYGVETSDPVTESAPASTVQDVVDYDYDFSPEPAPTVTAEVTAAAPGFTETVAATTTAQVTGYPREAPSQPLGVDLAGGAEAEDDSFAAVRDNIFAVPAIVNGNDIAGLTNQSHKFIWFAFFMVANQSLFSDLKG